MSEVPPEEMVRRVRGWTLDCRTGILLIPLAMLGREAELAARFNTDAVDFVRVKEKTFRPNSRFIQLDRGAVLEDLVDLCEGRKYMGLGDTDCFFIYNFDLALAYLERLERLEVWNYLRDVFRKQPKAIIFALPEGADALLPHEADRSVWKQGGRWSHLRQEASPQSTAVESKEDYDAY